MNILEEIQNCPVEWKVLKDVAILKNGKDWKTLPSGEVPVYGSGGEMGEFVSDYSYDKPTVLIPRKGSISNLFYIEKAFWNVDTIYYTEIDENQIIPKYFYYYLTTVKLEEMATNPTRPSLTQAILDKVKIPIPSLEIQEKIVEKLDKMTEYVTELTSELTSRKKQYSYYRDKLLSFEDEVYQVEWKTLNAVSERTSNISWNKIGDDEKFKYIDLSSVDRVSNKITETTSITKSTAPSRAQKIVKSNDIILGTTRPTLKRFTKITDDYNDQICSTGFYVFRTNGEVLPNYVYHIFSSSDFYKYLEENQSGASYPAISDALVKKYKIPVPSLEIQSRIVQVLDNFDTVCNDLNIGLPKEIELRQKQYEYFREKLLTFVAEGEYTESRVE